MNIIDAIHNEELFRPYFKDLSTWSSWVCVLKALFGISMSQDELETFEACTGRRWYTDAGFKEFWGICGRRGGKSRVAALVAVFMALFHDWKPYLTAGEIRHYPINCR